jgi:hypothetical protein
MLQALTSENYKFHTSRIFLAVLYECEARIFAWRKHALYINKKFWEEPIAYLPFTEILVHYISASRCIESSLLVAPLQSGTQSTEPT